MTERHGDDLASRCVVADCADRQRVAAGLAQDPPERGSGRHHPLLVVDLTSFADLASRQHEDEIDRRVGRSGPNTPDGPHRLAVLSHGRDDLLVRTPSPRPSPTLRHRLLPIAAGVSQP